MSRHIVEVGVIEKVEPHPNADRLDIVGIRGWRCVVGKGEFNIGDKAIYIPIDSVLSESAQAELFPPGSKISYNGRIKTIKIRGAISQGMAVKPDLFGLALFPVGKDVAEIIGITKWEPPEEHTSPCMRGNQASRKQINPHFHKYTDIENFKNYPELFKEGEPVIVTEKIHGTNFRCGMVKTVPNTLWKKVKKLFGLLPAYEFVYGSHNVQLQGKMFAKTWYAENVYAKIVNQYNLITILENMRMLNGKDVVIYGEIYGDGIQKGYTYGCESKVQKLAVFDVMVGDKYLDWFDYQNVVNHYHLPTVPTLYSGPFNLELIKQRLVKGPSILDLNQPIREGVVIRPVCEQATHMGRKVLKLINDDYLMKADTTEAH